MRTEAATSGAAGCEDNDVVQLAREDVSHRHALACWLSTSSWVTGFFGAWGSYANSPGRVGAWFPGVPCTWLTAVLTWATTMSCSQACLMAVLVWQARQSNPTCSGATPQRGGRALGSSRWRKRHWRPSAAGRAAAAAACRRWRPPPLRPPAAAGAARSAASAAACPASSAAARRRPAGPAASAGQVTVLASHQTTLLESRWSKACIVHLTHTLCMGPCANEKHTSYIIEL